MGVREEALGNATGEGAEGGAGGGNPPPFSGGGGGTPSRSRKSPMTGASPIEPNRSPTAPPDFSAQEQHGC